MTWQVSQRALIGGLLAINGALLCLLVLVPANFSALCRQDSRYILQKEIHDVARSRTRGNASGSHNASGGHEGLGRLCPLWFRHMHDDLAPWRTRGGIGLPDVEAAQGMAGFRMQIIKGRLYVEVIAERPGWESRMIATLWGVLMLLRRFPGQVADVDAMFSVGDWPRHGNAPIGAGEPLPVLFLYSGDKWHVDIPFPDFSFWGRPEVGILPWEQQRAIISAGRDRWTWKSSQPRAYWRGNAKNGRWNPRRGEPLRLEVMGCATDNATKDLVDLRAINSRKRHKEEERCGHRYGIYMEGNAWSISLKYSLACGMTILAIESAYFDFFSRGLASWRHVVPVCRETPVCKFLGEAIEWGNAHPELAEDIGREGRRFTQEDLSMDNVYSYMYHVLREYAALQLFVPAVRRGSREVTVEMFRGLHASKDKFYAGNVPVGPFASPPCRLAS